MQQPTEKLSVIEKIGYSLGDLAANLIFQTLMTFITFFYTDVYNIPPAKAAVIIFTGGMIGAFFNPLIGILADRTNTRWGKFRPWILFTSVPFGVIALMAFSTPDFGEQGKIIYAFITYVLLLFVYSANNLPYAALSGVLTGNMQERNSVSSYRFVAVMVAQFIIQALLLPIVLIMGDGDKAVGFSRAMTMFSIVGVVFFLITFITTKERITTVAAKSSKVTDDLKDLITNVPWLIILLVTTAVFTGLALKGGLYIYYFENYLDEAALAAFLDSSGFNASMAALNSSLTSMGLTEFAWPEDAPTSGFSVFNASGIILMIVGIGFSKFFADKFGKRNVFGIALFLATAAQCYFYFIPSDSIAPVFITQILHGFLYGITIPLLWTMIADVADYSEWKTFRRATAITFAAMIFGLKVGLSLGGALVGFMLDNFDYDVGLVTQTLATQEGIKLSMSFFAGIPFFIASGLMLFYCINKQMENDIEKSLADRRMAAAA
ncbi:MFS transporter [Marinagarivorans cellulosilyticus]|uniref:Major facilitator superfamily (MFS) profile domain-containing protein n=1 Tax=Marinagarivorans cellulosilyticus TaxID=2721545 RepID=A0AAN1WLN4_9GAMM|nr:MFS transporter [Marinagarivorans cellulosilyticus]BCD99898.1 hypothetical protein MARGE09_P4100 [Marinagarivorans cellulosilyticus]